MGGVLPTESNIQLAGPGAIVRESAGAGLSSRVSFAALRAILEAITSAQAQALIDASITALVDSSPGTLDTLNELAAALGDDPNFATTVTNAIAAKQATLVSGTNIKTVNSASLLGSGDLVVSASPGGSTTQVQYNNAGSFAGMANVTYDGTRLEANNGNTDSVTIGRRSGYGTVSNDAITIGYECAYDLTAGRSISQMIALGRHAAYGVVAAGNAIIAGHAASQYGKQASSSIILGAYASRNPTTRATFNAFSSVIIGTSAGLNAYASQTAVLIGENAGANSTNGTASTVGAVVIGWSAASAALNTGTCVIIGNQAGQNCSSYTSVYIGAYAGQNTVGSYNVFLGYEAGKSLSADYRLVIEQNATHRAGGTNALIYGEFDNRVLSFNASKITSTGTFRPGALTVGTLPAAASNTGASVNVTDSNTQTVGDTVAGGGSYNITVRSDGTNWKVVTGTTGNVVGPSSATDNAVARFDATTGKLLQDSSVTVSDTGIIASGSYFSCGSGGSFAYVYSSSGASNGLWLSSQAALAGGIVLRNTGSGYDNISMGGSNRIAWTGTGQNGYNATVDVSLARSASNTLSVYTTQTGTTLGNFNAAVITASGAFNLAPITKAALLLLTPNAATGGRWRVTDATPANREAYPDGTNWRYTSDDTVVT